jgi:hypothetical protein
LNNKTLSKPVNSTDLKNLSYKMKKTMLDKKINYDTWHQQDIKILLHKIAQNTE